MGGGRAVSPAPTFVAAATACIRAANAAAQFAVQAGHGVDGGLQQGLLALQGPLGVQPRGTVRRDGHVTGDHAGAITHRRHRQAHRQPAAVLAYPGPFALFDASPAGLGDEDTEAGVDRLVRPPGEFNRPLDQLLGVVQNRGSGLAEYLLGSVSQHAFGGPIEADDGAIGIGGDDAMAGAVQQGMLPGVLARQAGRRQGTATGCLAVIPDQTTQYDEHQDDGQPGGCRRHRLCLCLRGQRRDAEDEADQRRRRRNKAARLDYRTGSTGHRYAVGNGFLLLVQGRRISARGCVTTGGCRAGKPGCTTPVTIWNHYRQSGRKLKGYHRPGAEKGDAG